MKIEEAIQQKKFKDPQAKAWINLVYTHNQLMGRVNQVIKKFGITHQQFNVLRILRGRENRSAICSEVKSVMLDKNPDVTRLGNRLVAKELITRGVNENNRREVELSITEKGLDLLKQIDPELSNYNQFLYNLTDEEANQLSDLLDKLRS
ncbi:MarR family winged helix-turn-helix transcriptional regulator [Membranihabitans maritimus]|uniref:MarR family winged helix-turn-helix transcriptional regulator n=1 Tax=Membranihabitans maritimus TaxID=2904244 RepID=UPI001EFF7632|nr:MarR family transcriptional regulator [Membranihabitans maritimus]